MRSNAKELGTDRAATALATEPVMAGGRKR